MAYILRARPECCDRCYACETKDMLPGFITQHRGEWVFPRCVFEREGVQDLINRAIENCPGDCLDLKLI